MNPVEYSALGDVELVCYLGKGEEKALGESKRKVEKVVEAASS
jgi:hypothetical protein